MTLFSVSAGLSHRVCDGGMIQCARQVCVKCWGQLCTELKTRTDTVRDQGVYCVPCADNAHNNNNNNNNNNNHNNNNDNNTSNFPQECSFSLSRLVETASAVHVMMDVDSVSAARRRRERRLERRHGPVREEAPHLTRSEEGQGRGRFRDALHGQVPEDSQAVPGHPVQRRRSSSAPWSSSPTSCPMVQILDISGPQGGIRWWRCCGSLTCRLSSRSSQCP